MARKILILLAVLTAASSAFEQDAAESSTRFGLRAGLHLASIKIEEKSLPDYGNIIGFNAGAIADISISEFFYIQPGLFFSVKGAEYSEKYGSESYGTIYSLHYLEMPLLASIKIALDESLSFRLNAGPYIGIGIAGTIEEKYENSEYPQDNYSYSEDAFFAQLNLFGLLDFGMAFGVGIEFQNFYLGLNYDLGLANIAGYGSVGYYNRCMGIAIGYNF
jgi:hypothetical protein